MFLCMTIIAEGLGYRPRVYESRLEFTNSIFCRYHSFPNAAAAAKLL